MSDIVPFYEYSLDNARHCNEVDEWRASHKANIDCKKAIENAIADNYKDNHFNPDFASDIIEEFGFDRVNFILQYNLKQAQNDGRYSEKNKEWGKELYAPESNMRMDYLIGSHPILLDSFIDEVRSEWDKLNLWNSSHCISKSIISVIRIGLSEKSSQAKAILLMMRFTRSVLIRNYMRSNIIQRLMMLSKCLSKARLPLSSIQMTVRHRLKHLKKVQNFRYI